MPKPSDPPKPAADTPEDPLAGAPLDVVVEVLAHASAQLQGLQGADLKKHVAEVTVSVKALAKSVERKVQDEEQRKAAGAEVERLVDMLTRTGTATGAAIAKHRDAITKAFHGVEFQQIAKGLRTFSDWLQNPSSHSEAEVKLLLEDLQTKMGPSVGPDPKRDEAARSAAIKADVKASLDEIFRGKPKKT
jgi:hypothetical protein